MELDNLIFDRTQGDVDRVAYLSGLWQNGTFTGTTEELAEWASDLKGAYNASDLNRVLSAVEYLTDMLYDMGYNVPTVVPAKKTRYVEKEIEYIESSGTQYINTGFNPNNNTRVVMDVDILSSSAATCAIFGARNAVIVDAFVLWRLNGSFRTDYNNTTKQMTVSSLGRHVIDKNKNVTTIGNDIKEHEESEFQTNYPLALFALKQATEVDERMVCMRLYSCKIYDNDFLVRDFKPYYDSNGVACLYDAVSGTYYYNAGTGNFSASEAPTIESVIYDETNIPMQSQMDIYINNIQLLRDIFPYVAPNTPDAPENLTFEQANNIEEILYNLEQVLLAMQENFKLRQANTFFMIAGGVFNNA